MKNLVTHQTTKETVRVFYRVVMPGMFSNLDFATLQEANKEMKERGTQNPNMSEENIKYWESVRNDSTIVRVTETTKRVV